MEKNQKKNTGVCVCINVIYIVNINIHNIVNQLYFNLKKKCLQREGILNIYASTDRMLLNSLT